MKKPSPAHLCFIAVLALGLTACSPQTEAPLVAATPTAGDADAGKKTFVTVCSVCHGPQGAGVPGAFPPLAGSEIATAADPSRIIRIVLHGLNGPITVKGVTVNSVMPPQGAALTDTQIADVLTYVRQSWGNQAPPVTVEAVTAARAATASRTTFWTWDELTKSVP